MVEELDALHRPQALDEVGGFVRLRLNHPLAQIAKVSEQRYADHGIAEEGADDDERELGAVEEHHGQRDERHCAVDEREDQALADEIANRLDRGEAREHVANMPFLEERQREPDEMAEQSRAKGEVERVLKDDDDQRSEPRSRRR